MDTPFSPMPTAPAAELRSVIALEAISIGYAGMIASEAISWNAPRKRDHGPQDEWAVCGDLAKFASVEQFEWLTTYSRTGVVSVDWKPL